MAINENNPPLLPLFALFLKARKVKTKQNAPNRGLSISGLELYLSVFKKLKTFEITTAHTLTVPLIKGNSKREQQRVRGYWNRFHTSYSRYLYSQNLLDNYVGLHFKTIKTFMQWLRTEKQLSVGDWYKTLYVPREDTPIITLANEQLQQLLFNEVWYASLPPHLQKTRDLLVFGCFTGLRYSDLERLNQRNVEKRDGVIYLVQVSKKTGIPTRIKLPEQALEVLTSYKTTKGKILPFPSKNQFNKNLKALGEKAGWTWEVGKERTRNGKKIQLKTTAGKTYRFCDLLSSHVMRKTTITTLLMHGMPEHMVRKISGHAANSKEFFRYVQYTQLFLDEQTDAVFGKLTNLRTV